MFKKRERSTNSYVDYFDANVPLLFDLHNIFYNKGDTMRRVKSDTFATLVMCMRVCYLLGVKHNNKFFFFRPRLLKSLRRIE